jgi:hypothetical protein
MTFDFNQFGIARELENTLAGFEDDYPLIDRQRFALALRRSVFVMNAMVQMSNSPPPPPPPQPRRYPSW